MKRLILLLLAVGTLFMAVAPSSIKSYIPLSLPALDISSTLETKGKLESALADNKSAKAAETNARQNYQNAIAAFDSQRTLAIHYSDVYSLYKMISNVQGISFKSLHEADPNANWAKGQELNIEDYRPASELEIVPLNVQAVCMTLVVEDIAQGLNIVDKLTLPVCQIITTAPGTIEVTFLIGGGN